MPQCGRTRPEPGIHMAFIFGRILRLFHSSSPRTPGRLGAGQCGPRGQDVRCANSGVTLRGPGPTKRIGPLPWGGEAGLGFEPRGRLFGVEGLGGDPLCGNEGWGGLHSGFCCEGEEIRAASRLKGRCERGRMGHTTLKNVLAALSRVFLQCSLSALLLFRFVLRNCGRQSDNRYPRGGGW